MTRVAAIALMSLFFLTGATAQTPASSRWQGTTANGRSVTLELKMNGSQPIGALTIDGETTPISDVKVSFKTRVQGQDMTISGWPVAGGLELLPEGAENSVVLRPM
jgi:hypothetical protein